MSTTLEQRTGRQYVDFDEYIDFQLRKTRAGIKLTDILTASAGVAALVLLYLLTFVVLDHWVIPGGFSTGARWLLLGMVFSAAMAWIGWKVVWPYTRHVTGLYAARAIESTQPSLKSTLLNLVDLRRAQRQVSPEILNSLEKRAAVTLSHMDVDQAVDRRGLMRVSYLLLSAVVACCIYTLLSPKDVSSSIWRALFPVADISVPTRTEIVKVTPGDVEVLARTHLEVVADISGETPERVLLHYTTADQRYVDEPLEMRLMEDGVRQYQAVLSGENGRGLLQDVTYYVVAGDDRSADFRVTVITPPSAAVESVRYDFPEYMELEPRTQPGGHLDAWEGTRITLQARTNIPVKSAAVLLGDTEDTSQWGGEYRLQVVDRTKLQLPASPAWTLAFRDDGSHARFYRIDCTDEKGQSDPSPTLYGIKIRRDKKPDVVLLDPTRDLERPANAIVPLVVAASDDFKLSSVKLEMEKNGEELLGPYLFDGTVSPPRQEFNSRYDLKLQPFNLVPGDELKLWIVAQDNKRPDLQIAATPTITIRITAPVADEDVRRQFEQEKQEQQRRLDELRQDRDPEDLRPPEQPPEAENGELPQPADAADPNADRQPSDRQPHKANGDDQQPTENPKPRGGQKEGEDGESGAARPQDQPADDHEALRRLLERHQQSQRDAQQEPGQRPDRQQSPDRDQSDPNGQPDRKDPSEQRGPSEARPADDRQPSTDDRQDNGAGAGAKDDQTGKGGTETGESGSSSKDTNQEPKQETSGAGGKDPQAKPSAGEGRDSEKPLDGTRESTDPDPNARKERATGEETGPATGQKEPDPDAPAAQNELERQPGEEGAKSTRTSPNGKDNEQSPKQSETPKDAPNGQSGTNNASPKSTPQDSESKPPAGRESQSPDREHRHEIRRPEGTQTGSKAEPCPHCQGKGCAKCNGTGVAPADSSTEGEGQQDGSGKPGEEPGEGKDGGKGESSPEDAQQSGKKNEGEGGKDASDQQAGGKAPSGKDGQGNSGGKSDGGTKGSGPPTDAQSTQAGKATGQGGGSATSGGGADTPGPGSGGQEQPDGAGDGGGAPDGTDAADQANLEFAKQAADLMLKRLEDDLRRGEIDEKLLEDLGWTEDRMREFAERMRKQLSEYRDDQSPQAEARRRQFEEMLKSLDLKSAAADRQARSEGRQTTEEFGPRRLPVPAEYREAYEAFTRSLARQRGER